ncbi:alpha/beta fold hydrolase [Pseudalkalibacillus sp. JSM 102089]|uniref:alpha/beta fold hydrolase n=1 Tax=Pseudalkalibacillus sp. JSM 102089 TaxID=3229856 RepID=UPI003524D733
MKEEGKVRAHLLKWLGTRKVDLLGYSFGGELALEFAYAFKDEINKIVLSAPSLMATDIQKMVQIAGVSFPYQMKRLSKLLKIFRMKDLL